MINPTSWRKCRWRLQNKPLLIYHPENPRTLKKQWKNKLWNESWKSEPPVIWKSNSKTCVTTLLFEDWFIQIFNPEAKRFHLNQNLTFKVMLIIHNAPKPSTENFTFYRRVKIVFMLPNTTCLLQPMHQVVIQTFKYIKCDIRLPICMQP